MNRLDCGIMKGMNNKMHPFRTLPKISVFTVNVSSTMANLLTLGSTHPLAVSPPNASHKMYEGRAVRTEQLTCRVHALLFSSFKNCKAHVKSLSGIKYLSHFPHSDSSKLFPFQNYSVHCVFTVEMSAATFVFMSSRRALVSS